MTRPQWWTATITGAAAWLHATKELSASTKTAYANGLGIPRAKQSWRGAPTGHHNVRVEPDQLTFFPWCAERNLDPYTELTADALGEWERQQRDDGVAAQTRRQRLVATTAWYRHQRDVGATTLDPGELHPPGLHSEPVVVAPPEPRPFREYEELLAEATRCDAMLARFPGAEAGQVRAREILAAIAGACRELAAALLTDPTLATEPYATGRFRVVDLVTELARQLPRQLISAEVRDGLGARPERRAAVWEEAEALVARLLQLAAHAAKTVPRRDSTTENGSRAISRARLSTRAADVRQAAELLERAVADALAVAYPSPKAGVLAQIARDLHRHADVLDTWHTTTAEQNTIPR